MIVSKMTDEEKLKEFKFLVENNWGKNNPPFAMKDLPAAYPLLWAFYLKTITMVENRV